MEARAPVLLNRERASEVLSRAGLDGVVVSQPLNVYYATTKLPVLDRMTSRHQSLAVIPADPHQPLAYVGPAFEYYYNVSDSGLAPGIDVYLATPPSADPLRADGRGMMRILGPEPLDERENRRRAATLEATAVSDVASGLARVLGSAGLDRGTLGHDSLEAERWIAEAAPAAARRLGDDLLRHIRLVKTPAELSLLTAAAQANVLAVLAAVGRTRENPTLRALRQRFFSEAAERGNTGVFLLVDGVMDEIYDETLPEGRAFLVDGVSHRAFYQGDYARTACLGEPSAQMRRVTESLEFAWHEIRARLAPGLRFSDIGRIGREALRKAGHDYTVAFKPHSVGLEHEDQPRAGIDGRPCDIELADGMVLSVDCPLLDVGVGGTAHLEDLTLITADGSRPLHEAGPPLLVV